MILNDLVEALHRQIEDKTFITVDLPLLIIREGTAGFEGGGVMVSTPKYTFL